MDGKEKEGLLEVNELKMRGGWMEKKRKDCWR